MDLMRKRFLEGFKPIDLATMRPSGFHLQKRDSVKHCCGKANNGSGWRPVTDCPVCGSVERQVLMNKCDIDIVQCEVCHLGYSAMFPVDLGDVYSDESYVEQARRDYEQSIEYRMKRFGPERVQIIERWLDRDSPNRRLLDIGCGTGWFIEYAASQGFTVFGQEFGTQLAQYTAQRLNTTIWTCPVEEIETEEGFGAVTMFDVLEHMPNPLEMLTHIRNLLVPGGVLLLYVPNLASVGFTVLKEESALVSPAEHLLYFSEESMHHLAGEAGFTMVHTETKGMDVADIMAYYRDSKEQPDVVEFLRLHGDAMQSTIDNASKANHLRVVLKRRDQK